MALIIQDIPKDTINKSFNFTFNFEDVAAYDFTQDGAWANAGYTHLNGESTGFMGDNVSIPRFWVHNKNSVSACEITADETLKLSVATNTGAGNGNCWPRNNVGPAIIIPIPDSYDVTITFDVKVTPLGQFADYGGPNGGACLAHIGVASFQSGETMPNYDVRIALHSNTVNYGGNAAEFFGIDGGPNNVNGTTGLAPIDIEGTVDDGVLLRTGIINLKADNLDVWTGSDQVDIAQKSAFTNAFMRNVGNRGRALVFAVGQDRVVPLEFSLEISHLVIAGNRT